MNQRSVVITRSSADDLNRELDNLVGYMVPGAPSDTNEVVDSIACLSVLAVKDPNTGGYDWTAFAVVNMETVR